jgi:hypothetical protein
MSDIKCQCCDAEFHAMGEHGTDRKEEQREQTTPDCSPRADRRFSREVPGVLLRSIRLIAGR